MPADHAKVTSLSRLPPAITAKELAAFLPCFYDIPISYVKKFTRLSIKAINKARESHGNGGMDPWPFTTIKHGLGNKHTWASVIEARNQSMQVASETMREILRKASRKAETLRTISLTPCQRITMDLTPTTSREPRPITRVEMEEALRNMIDIPLKMVESILRCSLHTILMVRRDIGIHKWPYECICGGKYHKTMQEVAHQREHVISQLPQDSCLRLILEETSVAASTQVFHPRYNGRMYMPSSPSTPGSVEAADDEKEDIPSKPDATDAHEVHPCSLHQQPVESVEQGEFSSEATDEKPLFDDSFWETTTEMSQESRKFWDEIAEQTEDSFWGTNSDISPRTRKYWDSLSELSEDAFT